MRFWWIGIFLFLSIPNNSEARNFLISSADEFEFALQDYYFEDDTTSTDVLLIEGVKDYLVIPKGGKFSISPANFDILPCCEGGEGIVIDLTYQAKTIQTICGIWGYPNEFIILDHWGQFLSVHQSVDNDDYIRTAYENEIELGYMEVHHLELDGSGFTQKIEKEIEMRFSKSDGVLNYQHFLDTEYIEFDDGSISYTRYLGIDLIREGYELGGVTTITSEHVRITFPNFRIIIIALLIIRFIPARIKYVYVL